MSRVLASHTQVNRDVSFFASATTATPVADYGNVQVSSIAFADYGGVSDTDGFWIKGRIVADTIGNAQPAFCIGQPQTAGDATDGTLTAKGISFLNGASSDDAKASVFASTFGASKSDIVITTGADIPVFVRGGFTSAQAVHTSTINNGPYAPRTTTGGFLQKGREFIPFTGNFTVKLPIPYSNNNYTVALSYCFGTGPVEASVTNITPGSFVINGIGSQDVTWVTVGN